MTQETNVYDKRECVHDKRDLHMCADDTEHSHIHTGEKRPTCMTKDTYIYDKRDLHMCADDTEQSDIHTGEKRPTCTTKETYIYDKRDPEMCVTLSRFRPRERIQRITKTHLNK